jgi:anti-sigma B factor antagonist
MSDNFRAPPFSVAVGRDGPTATVAILGELDIATTPQLRAAIASLEPGYAKLVIDLSRCSFFASSGISILLDEHERGQGEGFGVVVINSQPDVQRMFDLARLGEMLTFQESDTARRAPS